MNPARSFRAASRVIGSAPFFFGSIAATGLAYAAGVSFASLGAAAGLLAWHVQPLILRNQNVNTEALQLKTDELVRATDARDELAGVQEELG